MRCILYFVFEANSKCNLYFVFKYKINCICVFQIRINKFKYLCAIFMTFIFVSGILGLLIFHHCTKFGAKMLIDAEIMAQNRNPSAILDFRKSDFWALGPPRSTSSSAALQCSQFTAGNSACLSILSSLLLSVSKPVPFRLLIWSSIRGSQSVYLGNSLFHHHHHHFICS